MNRGGGNPASRMRAQSAVDAASAMSTNVTFARCAQKCSTMEAPIPEPPPVTNTPLSARLGYCANRSLMIPFVVVGPSPIL